MRRIGDILVIACAAVYVLSEHVPETCSASSGSCADGATPPLTNRLSLSPNSAPLHAPGQPGFSVPPNSPRATGWPAPNVDVSPYDALDFGRRPLCMPAVEDVELINLSDRDDLHVHSVRVVYCDDPGACFTYDGDELKANFNRNEVRRQPELLQPPRNAPSPPPAPPRAPTVLRHLPHEQVHAGAPRAGRAPQDPRRLPRARCRLARGVPRHPDVGGRLPLPAARPRRPQPVRPHRDRGDGADARGVRADAHAAQPAHLAARRQGGLLLRRVSAARPPRRRRRRARRRRRRRRRRAREAVAPGSGRGEGGGARQLHRRRRREVRRLRPPQHRRRVDDRARRDHRRRRRRPPPPAGAPLWGAGATHRAHHAPAHALLHPRRPAPPQRDVRAKPAAAAPAAPRAAAAADAAPPLAATRSRPTRTSTSTASSRAPCCRPAARFRSRI